MTTTQTQTQTQTHPSSGASPARSTAVDRFLDAVRQASFSTADDLYAVGVVLDATVPGWRYTVHGDTGVRAEYGRWFNATSDLPELTRHSTASGEVIEYVATWEEDGVEHAGHHAHVLTIDPTTDRIVEDHVWCGGRWPAPLLAEMAAARLVETG